MREIRRCYLTAVRFLNTLQGAYFHNYQHGHPACHDGRSSAAGERRLRARPVDLGRRPDGAPPDDRPHPRRTGGYTGLAADRLGRLHIVWAGLNRLAASPQTDFYTGQPRDGYVQDAMYARR